MQLDPPNRWVQMGKLKVMLDKQKSKINDLDPLRNWQYLPIFEFNLKKSHFAQNGQNEPAPVLHPPQVESLKGQTSLETFYF